MDAGRTGIDGVDGRRVVILCGPPGAGKTTIARTSGLDVYDRDDDRWQGEADFKAAIKLLRNDPSARAVVIRSCATSSARAKVATMIGATHVFLVVLPPDECVRRVRSRRREDLSNGIASIPRWFNAFDDLDGVQLFPGWDHIESPAVSSAPIGVASRRW